MALQPGDTVCIRGAPNILYKVIAVNGSMLTILVISPQGGEHLEFGSTSIQTIDEYRVEKVEGV
ncbi:hypothetical protein QBC35DRAFT_548223 [Podospora australis]|uniref:Uncharacterized protein n=1 Tax=Podospora australis TaxID=1536484 RepID=A0AAN7AK11_9PEZI|nr:hypothetical protein QBC35DRAFT_548223 [Podospora australis]